MPTRWRSRAFWIAVERQAWRRTGDQRCRSQSSCSFLLRRGRILRLDQGKRAGTILRWQRLKEQRVQVHGTARYVSRESIEAPGGHVLESPGDQEASACLPVS